MKTIESVLYASLQLQTAQTPQYSLPCLLSCLQTFGAYLAGGYGFTSRKTAALETNRKPISVSCFLPLAIHAFMKYMEKTWKYMLTCAYKRKMINHRGRAQIYPRASGRSRLSYLLVNFHSS